LPHLQDVVEPILREHQAYLQRVRLVLSFCVLLLHCFVQFLGIHSFSFSASWDDGFQRRNFRTFAPSFQHREFLCT
jgi:hypothetical protein